MAEGYKRGEGQLKKEVSHVIYCHDDMLTLAENFPARLLAYFCEEGDCDVIGGAGSNRCIGDKWFLAGVSHCFGCVANLVHPGSPMVRNRLIQTVDLQHRIHALKASPAQDDSQKVLLADCEAYLVLQGNRGTLIGKSIEIQQRAAQGQPSDPELVKNLQKTMDDLNKRAEEYEKRIYTGAPTRIVEQETVPMQQPYWTTAVFGVPRRLVSGIQVLDGFFIAAKRGALHWDTGYKHFHLYDMDASYDAYYRGLKVAVVNDLELVHMSVGSYHQPEWKVAADHFLKKWKNELPPQPTGGIQGNSIGLQTQTPQDAFRIVERLIQQSEGTA